MTVNLSEKELFKYVRSKEWNKSIAIKNLLSGYNLRKLTIAELLKKLYLFRERVLLIDSRSEKEYEESSIPFSKNFPVLTNEERHNTGLIFKKYSQTAALHLAVSYADPKADNLRQFLSNAEAVNKEIFVYCWRGGGRSGYLSKMIKDLGYNSETLEGGFKSYRKKVNEYFSQNEFPDELIEISGNTGCGKSELLSKLSEDIPVIDLEKAALHYSSLLGHIPYEILSYPPVKNQSAFENNLFSQIFFNRKKAETENGTVYVIESESRKVGSFVIPDMLLRKMERAETVLTVCAFEARVKRIVRDYFGNDLRGIEPMKNIMREKEKYFRQQLGNKIYNDLEIMLNQNRVFEFTEIMIKEYYDKKYKCKGKQAMAVISTDNITSARNDVKEIYMQFISQIRKRV